MTDQTATKVEMYRLRIVHSTGGSHSGDWQYFENHKRFLEALMDAAISSVAHNYRSTDRANWLATSRWNEKVMGKENEKRWVEEIVGADKLVDGEWVELRYTFYPPRLELDVGE